MSEKIIIVDNVYSDDEIVDIENYIKQNVKWEYNQASDDGHLETIFWKSDFLDKKMVKRIIRDFVLYSEIDIEAKPDRIYLNGQTYGLDGGYHTDVQEDDRDAHTLLYMVNSKNVDDIGDFQYIDPSSQEVETVKFVSGRFVLFPSKWFHRGLAPKTKNQLRMTLAYKALKV